jgi:hypothetical protein
MSLGGRPVNVGLMSAFARSLHAKKHTRFYAQLTRPFSASASASPSSTSSSSVRMMRSRGFRVAALHFVGDGGLARLRCRSMVFKVVLSQ